MAVFSSLYGTRLDRELGTDDSTQLHDVFPCMALNDVPDGCLRQSEVTSDRPLWLLLFSGVANQSYFLVRHLGHSVCRSAKRLRLIAFRYGILNVVGGRAEKQMCRITAQRRVATVADVISGWNRLLMFKNPRDPVWSDVLSLFASDVQKPVSVRCASSSPQPAVILTGDWSALMEANENVVCQMVWA